MRAQMGGGIEREFRRRPGAPAIEMGLILTGLAVLFFAVPHIYSNDGLIRFQALSRLIQDRTFSGDKFPMMGPLFSSPLWIWGSLFNTQGWWCARYNFFLLAGSLYVLYRILKSSADSEFLRLFTIVLIAGSMFPAHARDYLGEMFTAWCVALGAAMVCVQGRTAGWGLIGIGVVNTPAAFVGMGLMVVAAVLKYRSWKPFLFLAATAGLIVLEWRIRRGGLFVSGYENEHGIQSALMPYSGLPSFSYPFFFGLIAIIFSFGKGLVFFSPALFLPVTWRDRFPEGVRRCFLLWILFLAGLVVVYSKWWSWYGGWFWGPRFFLFSSIPAAFLLAVHLRWRPAPFSMKWVVLIVLTLSIWVGMSGVIFNQKNLDVCQQYNYSFEFLCWFVPEYSVLWRPFVIRTPFELCDWCIGAYFLVVYMYLAAPIFREIAAETVSRIRLYNPPPA